MDTDSTYMKFKLKNREFTFTTDVSTLPCGLNGALYFVEMDGDGGMANHPGNKAGAAYGTGTTNTNCTVFANLYVIFLIMQCFFFSFTAPPPVFRPGVHTVAFKISFCRVYIFFSILLSLTRKHARLSKRLLRRAVPARHQVYQRRSKHAEVEQLGQRQEQRQRVLRHVLH